MKTFRHVSAVLAGIVMAVASAMAPAQSTDLSGFLPRPPAGWASDDLEGMPLIPGQAMATYYREGGDGDDATLIIARQQGAAPAPTTATGEAARETPVEVNGFRGKITEADGGYTLALPLGNHAVVITTGAGTRREDLLALARAVDTAALAKR